MSVQVDAVIAGILGEITRTANETSLELLAELIEATPVDTGEARSGWRLNGDGAEALLVGDGVAISVENPVEHMTFLAHGSSPQAPAGWIEETVERVAARKDAEVQSREVRL